jgi:peptidoglycan/xylan/chitin deacetylase (PgdA/CDA1 family)
MGLLKKVVRSVLALPGASSSFRPLLRDCGVILMLHRFTDPDRGVKGDDPARVRQFLAYLRKKKYEILSLGDVFSRLAEGKPLRGAIAFTIDDGYYDQAAIGGEVFAEYDCPVTVFITSGFVDGQLWFWWDKIDHVFRNSTRKELRFTLADEELRYSIQDARERDAARADFIGRCKKVPDAEKHAAIARLAATAEVALPEKPPAMYAPLTWDQARKGEGRGMTFGPHTVTHPILSNTPDDQSDFEICRSWERIQAEVRRPVPVFCYPNGQWGDFGDREVAILQRAGLKGAVLGLAGYARVTAFHGSAGAPFRVPRFCLPEQFVDLVQYVSGMERMKEIVRGGAA